MRKMMLFAVMAGVCGGLWADVYQWQSAYNTVSYNWKDAINWVSGVYPALDGGHEIDFSADTTVTAYGSGQTIERVKLYNGTGGINISSIYGSYGRWLTIDWSCLNPVPSVVIGDPNDFYGLWCLTATLDFKFANDASFTPVMQRFSTKGNITFDVPESAAVIVSNVVESGTIGKSGAGTLKVMHPGGNTASFRMSAGTLQVEGARRFTAAEVEAVMAKAAFHVDASKAASVCTNAAGRVTRWSDVRGETGYPYGQQLVQNGYTLPLPKIASNYQNGLDVMDFGPFAASFAAATNSGNSAAMYFNDSDWFNKNIYVAEAIVVEGLHDANAMPACLFAAYNDKGLRRTSISAQLCISDNYADSVPVGASEKRSNLNARDGDWGINGRKVLPTTVWTNDAMCVFSLRSRDEKTYMRINCWGSDYGSNAGGIRVGEALYFTNHLSYAERKNVIRYLQAKWGCTDDGEEDVYDVGTIQDTSGTATLDLSKDLAVREIAVNGDTFEKTGAGKLEVGVVRALGTGAEVPVTVSGGSLAFGPLTQPSANPQLPSGSFRHYDASDETSFTYTTADDGTRQVTEWRDQSGDAAKTATRIAQTHGSKTVSAYSLGYPALKADGLNGMSTLSFGPSTSVATENVTNSAAMCFDSTLSSKWDQATDKHLQTVLMVCRRPNVYAYAWLLGGTCLDTPSVSFHPGNSAAIWRREFAHPFLLGGETAVNGALIDWDVDNTSLNQYHVLRLTLLDKLSANTFGLDRDGANTNAGGIDLAEVVLYDRPLSRQEIVDAEAYLMKKWLNKEHPNAAVSRNASLTFAATATPEFSVERDLALDTLSVDNSSFTKKGTGKLTVDKLVGSFENLAVEGGELNLSLNANPPLFHFDALNADSLTTFTTANADGSVRTNIAAWADVRANGLKATPMIDSICVTNPELVCVQTRTGVWRPALDFGKYRADAASTDDGTTAGLAFSKRFTNVREVFTIHADTDSSRNAFLFCDSSSYDYHRSGSGVLINSKWTTITNESNSHIYVNGVEDSLQAAISYNVWYLINIERQMNTAVSQIGHDRNLRAGGMRCCEQLGFSEPLTAERRNYLTRHMQYKWFAEGTEPVWTNATLDTVSVSADAVLNLADRDCLHLSEFTSGTGALKGGLALKAGAVWHATAVENAAEAFAISGTVGSEGAWTLNVSPAAGVTFLAPRRYALARVGDTALDLSQVTLTVNVPLHAAVKAVCEDNVLYLQVMPRGITINFR